MDLLGEYETDSDDEGSAVAAKTPAPPLTLLSLDSAGLTSSNPSVATPGQPPTRALVSSADTTQRKVPTGAVSTAHLHDEAFEAQMHMFERTGRAVDPGTSLEITGRLREWEGKENQGKRRPRREQGEQGSPDKTEQKKMKRKHKADVVVPTSRFCLGEEFLKDYQGRSWVQPKKGWKTFEEMETYTPYIPKRCVESFEGHKGGVSAIRFFPKYGHLLLSAGMDNYVKIWDTMSHKKCMRIYMGHSQTVRDVVFNNDGSQFLSGSYDKTVKLWDTETGKVLSSFSCGSATPYCLKFHPEEGQDDEFLVGRSDKKIVQMDTRDAQKVVQEYNEHMGAVNSLTFVDSNRRFVSSSDDKTLRVWDYGIPVVIKYISDPSMHSMPVVVLHPNQKWIVCQSLDNQVLLFSARNRFNMNKKKHFKGHSVAGYACGLTFSADGRFLGSGDGLGRIFFWDWKTSRMFRVLQAHDGVCIAIEWHPTEASKVITCGWDGYIKYWD